MKTGTYKDMGGGEQNVVQYDPDTNKVLVYYGERRVWYGAEDFNTWTKVEESDATVEIEPTPENQPEPIAEEPTTPEIAEPEKKEKKKPGRKKKTE